MLALGFILVFVGIFGAAYAFLSGDKWTAGIIAVCMTVAIGGGCLIFLWIMEKVLL